MSRRARSAVAVALVALAGGVVAGCGDDEEESERPTVAAGSGETNTTAAAGGPAQAAASVAIEEFKFMPATVTVKAGGKVTWRNLDTAPHNAENTGENGPAEFTTRTPLNQGQSDSVTFSEPGTYKYYCVYHRFMEADVIVN